MPTKVAKREALIGSIGFSGSRAQEGRDYTCKRSTGSLRQEVEQLLERSKASQEELVKSRGLVQRGSVPAHRGIDVYLPSSSGGEYSLEFVALGTPLSWKQ